MKISKTLTSENWDDWNLVACGAFGVLGVAVVVHGEGSDRPHKIQEQHWWDLNDTACNAILSSVSETILPTLHATAGSTAHEIYKRLEAMYASHGAGPFKDAVNTFFQSGAPPMSINSFQTWAVGLETSLGRLRRYKPNLKNLASAHLLYNLPADIAYIHTNFTDQLRLKQFPCFETILQAMRSAFKQLGNPAAGPSVHIATSGQGPSSSKPRCTPVPVDAQGKPMS